MSVDLVGSTAFKAKVGDDRANDEIYPIWLNRTRNFYRDFPRILSGHYLRQKQVVAGASEIADAIPQVWKTVGDEIIFCVRLICLEHLAICFASFVKSLSDYGDLLSDSQSELDVKGCAWIAPFPAPNVTINSPHKPAADTADQSAGDQLDEEQELLADMNPGSYDFLGKNIDIGFRVSRFAQASQMAASLELAWLLAKIKHHRLIDADFYYHGGEILKGVLNNQAYPVVTVDTERAHSRRELYALERAVHQRNPADPNTLQRYLHKFMEEHGIDTPILVHYNEKIDAKILPDTYKKFKSAWVKRQEEDKQRARLLEEAGREDVPPSESIRPDDAMNIKNFEQWVLDYISSRNRGEARSRPEDSSSTGEPPST